LGLSLVGEKHQQGLRFVGEEHQQGQRKNTNKSRGRTPTRAEEFLAHHF